MEVWIIFQNSISSLFFDGDYTPDYPTYIISSSNPIKPKYIGGSGWNWGLNVSRTHCKSWIFVKMSTKSNKFQIQILWRMSTESNTWSIPMDKVVRHLPQIFCWLPNLHQQVYWKVLPTVRNLSVTWWRLVQNSTHLPHIFHYILGVFVGIVLKSSSENRNALGSFLEISFKAHNLQIPIENWVNNSRKLPMKYQRGNWHL